MIEIAELDKASYKGQTFKVQYWTNGYYDIEATEAGFHMSYQTFGERKEMSYCDAFFCECPEEAAAFGAFEKGKLLGYVEGALEKWNNRYRIRNIYVFDHGKRHRGIGTLLMKSILEEAVKSGARMAVLETQSCNEIAISFYKKQGFKIIGLDLFAYSNRDPQRHEVRMEMGKLLEILP